MNFNDDEQGLNFLQQRYTFLNTRLYKDSSTHKTKYHFL
ncbi:hypothetical protein CLV42_101872 [Chitinophaga ginsengisoli]|uniref:Uncharacterized protein n=1 Tax=Chitinophaga ginsengisoli TaxID=363837 RepID=A0A2P8GQ65_9BACT|nr:hypothetical protein CLV42_101872 [Chitinophaga ginsengisoli]